ncbi:hypothetical protein [Dyella mobilis]|uniref:hypothetical protein n=1 Tax=Dyella mobilis TaxID=1849582 RepID=UPI001959154C|nr:hypothetical protein [Dyella mobilis]GLQ99365.1 hypothetical protein GCM10007863_37850 [Dyella mobilis]
MKAKHRVFLSPRKGTAWWLTCGFLAVLTAQAIAATDTGNAPPPAPALSWNIPTNITVTTPPSPPTLDSLQHDFDVFSWQTFVALNWPANADGSPNTNMTIGQDTNEPVVWESYRESRTIFLPGGDKPADWGQNSPLPPQCDKIDAKHLPPGTLRLTQVGKTPNVLDESGEPFKTGPLIDQNGKYARFSILTNQAMFNYIVNNQLYSKKGQQDFNADADFPPTKEDSQEQAIMIKTSWVEMGGKYDPSKFFTTWALVYDNPAEEPGVKPSCTLKQVGLVGFHIGHKTISDPQWIWSTFEHVDNVPTVNQPISKAEYNFFNPACKDCQVNEPPPRPWNPGNEYTQPTQVERVIAITDDANQLNAEYHQALNAAVPGSVWQNYELVSTQWPTNAKSKTDPTGVPAPSFLANTTLETYIQGHVKQTSSSCIACHNNATQTNGKFSDFTYLLQRAQ